jgi:hypothetical protein
MASAFRQVPEHLMNTLSLGLPFVILGKLIQVLTKHHGELPFVKHIIIFEDLAGKPTDTRKCPVDIQCHNFRDIVAMGQQVGRNIKTHFVPVFTKKG